MRGEPGVTCFLHSQERRHLRWIQNFVTYNFVESDQDAQSFLQGSFSIQLTKILHKNRGEALASIPL